MYFIRDILLRNAICPFGTMKEFISYRNRTEWDYIEFAKANISHERERYIIKTTCIHFVHESKKSDLFRQVVFSMNCLAALIETLWFRELSQTAHELHLSVHLKAIQFMMWYINSLKYLCIYIVYFFVIQHLSLTYLHYFPEIYENILKVLYPWYFWKLLKNNYYH